MMERALGRLRRPGALRGCLTARPVTARFDPSLLPCNVLVSAWRALPARSCCAAAGKGNTAAAGAAAGEVINKTPVAAAMNPDTYLYLLKHTREPAVLRALREETASVGGSNMQISPEQVACWYLLATCAVWAV